jgi:hypothetical protein
VYLGVVAVWTALEIGWHGRRTLPDNVLGLLIGAWLLASSMYICGYFMVGRDKIFPEWRWLVRVNPLWWLGRVVGRRGEKGRE